MSSFMKLRNTFFRRPSSLLLLRHHSSPATPAAVSTDHLDPIDYKKLPSDYNPATFDPTEHRTPPSDRVWRLVDEVSLLTLQEVAELSGILMRKASISDPPIIAVMKPGAAFPASAAGAGAPEEEEAKPEKTVFELKLESFEASSKIKVIKEVRGFTTLGLKEAKELVERAPVLIKAGVSKEEGEQIIEKMKGAGAKVVME